MKKQRFAIPQSGNALQHEKNTLNHNRDAPHPMLVAPRNLGTRLEGRLLHPWLPVVSAKDTNSRLR